MAQCNLPLLFDIMDSLSHIWLHLGTWYSNRIAPGIGQKFFQSPDNLGHHEAVEALVPEILSVGPFDETLHYCGCIINVGHPFSKSACQTGASIFSQPLNLFWL